MEFALLVALVIISIINLVIVIAIGRFIVLFRDRVDSIISDLIKAMEFMWGAIPIETTSETTVDRAKTWDEKYEEELEAMNRRLQSGLDDLPSPVLSWGSPPAMNPQKADGLSIKDVVKSPMNANRVDNKSSET